MPTLHSARFALRAVVILAAVLAYVSAQIGTVRFSSQDFDFYGTVIAVFLPLWGLARLKGFEMLEAMIECLFMSFALSVPILFLSYVAASAGMPLFDGTLIEIDRLLGFDWRGFVGWVDASPQMSRILRIAYGSLGWQLMLLPLLLVMMGQAPRAYVTLAALAVLGLIACAVSAWLPALGGYPGYGLTPDDLHNVPVRQAFGHVPHLLAVRTGAEFEWMLDRVEGLIALPSVHAGGALLCVWAGWRMRLLRYPIVALNLLMLMATVSHGGHYLFDIFAGWFAAAFAIHAVLSACSVRQGEHPAEIDAQTVAVTAGAGCAGWMK